MRHTFTASHPVGTVTDVTVMPTPEQVLSLAPNRAAAMAATAVADPAAWSGAGCDDRAVWGAYIATAAEPYEVAVDLTGPAFRCSCPSRRVPCKHCLGLLLLHANHVVAPANRLPFVAQWLQRRGDQQSESAVAVPDGEGGEEMPAAVERSRIGGTTPRRAPPDAGPDTRRLERAERMAAGLRELDRWLADRVRGGLTAGELMDEATWDRVAARLVDAQCGGLANRVRRVASKVGQHARWHEDVLEELAILHALAVGAQRTGHLPIDLADGLHAAAGLTTAKDDVLESVPTTALWTVVGESRVGEGRITVQRTWLMAESASGDGRPTWALVLAFGAFGNEVETEYAVGQRLHADVHWYPASARLRALVGRQHAEASRAAGAPTPQALADALAACGWALAREPWLERYPVCVSVVPAPLGNGRWALVDGTGSLPVVPGFWRLAEIVAASGGRPITVMGEWSNEGVLPLTLWTDGQVISL
jgi:hypothetical protein